MFERSRRDRGFALLWTLALLMLAAVVLLDLSRRSAGKAIQAVQAQEDLQLRWAMASCRKTILQQAEAILSKVENEKNTVIPATHLSQQLGDWQLDVIVSDEQAKANINTLYLELGPQRIVPVLRRLAADARTSVRFNLRPDPRAESALAQVARHAAQSAESTSPPGESNAVSPFVCWEQILDASDPARVLEQSTALAQWLTIWGDGRLNLRRASPELIRIVLERHVSGLEIQKFLQARQQRPGETPEQWLAAMELTPEKQAAIGQWVTDQSACYSVQIIAKNGRRTDTEWATQGQAFVYRSSGASTTQATSQPVDEAIGGLHMHRLIW